MKVERAIGILSVLLQKDMVTAAELAQRFEVSVRTILRDLDGLSEAGIPIVTRQGMGGGVSIMEGYKLDRTLLTSGEMRDILAGLQSLDSVHGTNRYRQLMEKLSADSAGFLPGSQSMLIDLSSWHKDSLAPKIEQIRRAIDGGISLQFLYYAPKGEAWRTIEPYYLVFRWSSWYVWGWCKDRKDYRLFKLNRMEKLRLLQERFEKRTAPLPELENERIFPGGIRVKALFAPDCKWRLVEEFGVNCFAAQPDGRLLFQADYTDRENLFAWLMTFGDKAELLEPEEFRQELRQRVKKMLERYDK